MNISGEENLRRRGVLLSCLVLSGSILLVYWSVQRHDFVNVDDIAYVVENRHVQGGLGWAGFLWAMRSMEACNWHPVTWLSLMLDYELYGLYPGGYHWTNVIIHLLSTVILYLALRRMTGKEGRSFVVSLLFGIHPLHVESVAWVAERKDVLSGFFWMAALWFYGVYVERGGWPRYLPVLASFVLGLLSKPMVVTLPFVLLLLDYWPLGRFSSANSAVGEGRGFGGKRFSSLLMEKVPFIALTLVSCAVTYYAQYRGNAMAALVHLPFWTRVGNAFVSYGQYVVKMFWPDGLAVFYPHPEAWSFFSLCLAVLFFTAVSAAVVYHCTRHPYLFAGWFWYVGTLVPVIGLVQVGGQAMADRYTYIPLIGLFIMITWAMGDLLLRGWRLRIPVLGAVSAAVIVVLMVVSSVQVGYWRDSVSLYEHALAVTKDNPLAHHNLSMVLLEKNKYREAISHIYETIRINQNYRPFAYNNMGLALALQGKNEESLAWFQQSLRILPDFSSTHYNLADALFRLGRLDDALFHYRSALKADPDNPRIHNSLGVVLVRKGNYSGAAAEYRAALDLDPRHAGAHNNLAMLLSARGRTEEAISHFRQALTIQPNYANAHYNLALALKRTGLSREAGLHFREAARINPRYEDKRSTAGKTVSSVGRK